MSTLSRAAIGLGAVTLLPAALALPSGASADPIVKLKKGHADAIDVAYEDGDGDAAALTLDTAF